MESKTYWPPYEWTRHCQSIAPQLICQRLNWLCRQVDVGKIFMPASLPFFSLLCTNTFHLNWSLGTWKILGGLHMGSITDYVMSSWRKHKHRWPQSALQHASQGIDMETRVGKNNKFNQLQKSLCAPGGIFFFYTLPNWFSFLYILKEIYVSCDNLFYLSFPYIKYFSHAGCYHR